VAASVKLIFFGEKEKGASRRLAAAEKIIVFLSMVFLFKINTVRVLPLAVFIFLHIYFWLNFRRPYFISSSVSKKLISLVFAPKVTTITCSPVGALTRVIKQ